jgi:hypothetical protein
MDTVRRDSGSIVVGWLTKVAIAVAVVGVMLFDVLSVTAANLGASDDASQAATVAQAEWRNSHDVQVAYDAAVESLPSDSESISPSSFRIDPDGTVHLVVRRDAKTVLVRHIGPLKHYANVHASGEASPAAP